MNNKMLLSLFAGILLFVVLPGTVPVYAADKGIQSDFIFLMTEQKINLSYILPGTILDNFRAFHITYIMVIGAEPEDIIDPVTNELKKDGTYIRITATNLPEMYSDLNTFAMGGFLGSSLLGNWAYSETPVVSYSRTTAAFVVGAVVTFVLFGTEEEYWFNMTFETSTQ